MAPARTVKSQKKEIPSSAGNKKTDQPVSWPALPTPEQRSHPLELEELVASQIILLHGFFPAKVCSSWTHFLSERRNIMLEATPPAKRGEAQRTNHRFSVKDEAFAKALWQETGLAEVIANDQSGVFTSSESQNGKPIGLNANIRVSCYEPFQNGWYWKS